MYRNSKYISFQYLNDIKNENKTSTCMPSVSRRGKQATVSGSTNQNKIVFAFSRDSNSIKRRVQRFVSLVRSRVTFLSVNCCFNELVQYYQSSCCSSTTRTSSHRDVTYSRHDIAEN